jgi:hypothetical protein
MWSGLLGWGAGGAFWLGPGGGGDLHLWHQPPWARAGGWSQPLESTVLRGGCAQPHPPKRPPRPIPKQTQLLPTPHLLCRGPPSRWTPPACGGDQCSCHPWGDGFLSVNVLAGLRLDSQMDLHEIGFRGGCDQGPEIGGSVVSRRRNPSAALTDANPQNAKSKPLNHQKQTPKPPKANP